VASVRSGLVSSIRMRTKLSLLGILLQMWQFGARAGSGE
jgi:hypothetical protein